MNNIEKADAGYIIPEVNLYHTLSFFYKDYMCVDAPTIFKYLNSLAKICAGQGKSDSYEDRTKNAILSFESIFSFYSFLNYFLLFKSNFIIFILEDICDFKIFLKFTVKDYPDINPFINHIFTIPTLIVDQLDVKNYVENRLTPFNLNTTEDFFLSLKRSEFNFKINPYYIRSYVINSLTNPELEGLSPEIKFEKLVKNSRADNCYYFLLKDRPTCVLFIFYEKYWIRS